MEIILLSLSLTTGFVFVSSLNELKLSITKLWYLEETDCEIIERNDKTWFSLWTMIMTICMIILSKSEIIKTQNSDLQLTISFCLVTGTIISMFGLAIYLFRLCISNIKKLLSALIIGILGGISFGYFIINGIITNNYVLLITTFCLFLFGVVLKQLHNNKQPVLV